MVDEYPQRFANKQQADDAVQSVRHQIHEIVRDLFMAYENEYSVFCPMNNCFELYGLDFLLDEQLNVSFLEVNPGPDFKQTGDRLRSVIVQLWEQAFRIVIDGNLLKNSQESHEDYDVSYSEYWKTMSPDFTMVYSKEWSVSQLKGGMSLK